MVDGTMPLTEPSEVVREVKGHAVEDVKDGLVVAENLKEGLGVLRERARGTEKFFRRLADTERAAAKSLRRSLGKIAPARPAERDGENGLLANLVRAQALWDQRASQGESLAGVWESEQRRWAARGSALQEARRRIEDDTRPTARELCAARAQAERLQRKHAACRLAAIQALRARESIEEHCRAVDFATACAVPSRQADRELQKVIKKADSAFRDHVLTKQALVKHHPSLQCVEEQYKIQIRAVLLLSREEQDAFCRELKESLQLAVSSLHVFSLTTVDVHGELFGADGSARCVPAPFPLLMDGSLGSPLRSDFSSPMTSDIAELSESQSARLESDRMSLRHLQILFAGAREAEDAVLRGFALAQLPSSGSVEQEHIGEAMQWLRSAVQLRVEAAGAVSTLLVERLLPALDQQLSDVKADIQLVQEEQRRTASSISHAAQARQQKLSEVPSLAMANGDSELIFCSRMARILEEARQRVLRRCSAHVALVDELLTIERERLHARVCDTAPHTLRRLAAAAAFPKSQQFARQSSPPTGSFGEPSSIGSFGPSGKRRISRDLDKEDDEEPSVIADDSLLDAEEKRVKIVARAVSDFTGKDMNGFAFKIGDEIRVTLAVADCWIGIDPQGISGEFPSHHVEVDGRSTSEAMPDLVTLFKKHVSETEDYVPSAEDEEFASRFSEYLASSGSSSGERVLASFSCALLSSRKVPLQGRLYATARCVGFFSHFSDSSLLGDTGDTVVLFRLSELARIEKRANALIFQNSIEVTLNDSTVYFFASFAHRDSAFEYLSNLRSVWQRVGEEEAGSLGFATIAHDTLTTEARKEVRDFRVFPATRSAPYPQGEAFIPGACSGAAITSPLKYELPGRIFGVGLEELFDALFRDFATGSFQAAHETERGAQLVGAPMPWSPAPVIGCRSVPLSESRTGDSYGDADVAVNSTDDIPRRQATLWRPVAAAAWMRRIAKVPEKCECVENWSMHRLGGDKGFVVQIEADLSGVPFADYFTCRIRYKAVTVGELRTQLDAEIELDWRKSTLLQSRIEQGTTDEFRRIFDSQFLPQATRVLVKLGGNVAGSGVPVGALEVENCTEVAGNHSTGDVFSDASSPSAQTWRSSASSAMVEVFRCAHRELTDILSRSWRSLCCITPIVALLIVTSACCVALLAVLMMLLRVESKLDKLLQAMPSQNLVEASCVAGAGASQCLPG